MRKTEPTIAGRQLDRGSVIGPLVASGVHVDDCWSEWGPPDGQRPLLHGLTLTDLRLTRVALSGAVLRDVRVEGLSCDKTSMFFFANQFERVTLRGRVGTVILDPGHVSPEYERAYVDAIRAAEADVEWTLDITEAVGEIDVRGYAADRIRRDPETQVVVRRENLLDGRWRTFDWEGTSFRVGLDLMVRAGWPDTVLTVDATRRNHRTQLSVLRRLRDEGIADQR